MKKRGVHGIELAMWLAIAAVGVMLAGNISSKLWGPLMGVDPVTATEKSIFGSIENDPSSLVGKLEGLGPPTSSTDHSISLEKGYMLFIFNRDPQYLKFDKGIWSGVHTLYKPAACLGQTCVCLCRDWECKKERPQCAHFYGLNAIVVEQFHLNWGEVAEGHSPDRWFVRDGPFVKSFSLTLIGNKITMRQET